MENFKALLQAQKEALTKDIDQYIIEIQKKEIELEEMKDKKSEAQGYLKSIEKRLSKQS